MSPKRKRETADENRRLRAAGRATENDEQLEAIEFRLRQLLAEVTADLGGRSVSGFTQRTPRTQRAQRRF